MKLRDLFGIISIGIRFYPRILFLRRYQVRYLRKGKKPDQSKIRKEANKMLEAFIKSGPIFIKFGQLLSARRDILPEEYMEELSKLQDKVPFPDFNEVEKLIKNEIGDIDKNFEYFDKGGLSGASLGLVYKAKFKGKDVAVKVHRPNIEKIIERDKPKVRALIDMFERNTGKTFALKPLMEEFLNSLSQELDYEREAESIEIIERKLEEMDLDFNVIVPKVYKEISTKKVLVMEYLDFIKITDVETIKLKGINLSELAKNVDKIFLRLALREGRFHADPHPGNLGVREDGSIVLLDFGMTSEISQETRDRLIMSYYYLSKLDAENLVDALIDLGLIDPLADKALMVDAIRLAMKSLEGKNITEMEYKELVRRADDILLRFPFRLPYNLTLFARMSIILEGLCKNLDPNFNFVKTVFEIMQEEKAQWKVLIRRIKDIPYKSMKMYNEIRGIPELVRSIYLKINNFESRNYTSAIIASGLFVAAALSYKNLIVFSLFLLGGLIMSYFSLMHRY